MRSAYVSLTSDQTESFAMHIHGNGTVSLTSAALP
jgi:hypothetical protein